MALAAIPLGILTVVRWFGSADVPPAVPTRSSLIGTWQTPSLPAAEWMATYRRVGGSDAAARAFLGPPMAGPAREHQIVLQVTETEWALFVSPDGGGLEPGWHGTYALDGPLVRVRESSGLCEATYAVALSGGALRIWVVDDGCGATDLLAQRTIYETAEFRRVTG